MQTALACRKRYLERALAGIAHETGGELVARFHGQLPFELTAAQKRTIAEIDADLASAAPMHRLLQGDVGAGKTVVALTALLTAIQGGHQGALMAPTEVLAEQHHLSTPIDARRVGGARRPDAARRSPPARRAVDQLDLTGRASSDPGGAGRWRSRPAGGDPRFIQEGVDFALLGVVVVDEQHRFGVEQRAGACEQGESDLVPDVLVMTATPIPRTAMTVYGDLDVSVLDDCPGRTSIDTQIRATPDNLGLEGIDVWQAVRDEVGSGRQAYVVCPLVEESEKLEVRSAEETFEQLRTGELAGLRVGLLHGRLTSAEKSKVMDRFRSGALDVLVATTVIEVGVDVPDATVMVVLDADRFDRPTPPAAGPGGPGKDRSHRFLVAPGETPEASTRLRRSSAPPTGSIWPRSTSTCGARGTIGGRQTGRNDLKLASLRRDRELVELARDVAFEIVDADPTLDEHPLLADEVELLLGAEETEPSRELRRSVVDVGDDDVPALEAVGAPVGDDVTGLEVLVGRRVERRRAVPPHSGHTMAASAGTSLP